MSDLDNILNMCLNQFESQHSGYQIDTPNAPENNNVSNNQTKQQTEEEQEMINDLLAELPGLEHEDVTDINELLDAVEQIPEEKPKQTETKKTKQIEKITIHIPNVIYSKEKLKTFSISKLKKIIKQYKKENKDEMTDKQIKQCNFKRFIEKSEYINCVYNLYNSDRDKLNLLKPKELINILKGQYNINPLVAPYFINEKAKLIALILKLKSRLNRKKMAELTICGYIREQCDKVDFEYIIPDRVHTKTLEMFYISYKKLKALCGQQLIHRDGSTATFENHIAGADLVAFYFSGRWCPPSKLFTAKLKEFYDGCVKNGYKFQIIFLSSDRTENEMMDYFQSCHGNYLAVPHWSNHNEYLSKYFNVSCIPTLCVVNDQADVIDMDGRGTVANKGQNAIKQWLEVSKGILQKKNK